ncbi:MAG: MFS transporter [Gammaproteobacteria bacterium]|nr:MFS transporter [Gammaproteobacteria bacterium]MDH5652136.1 MFS transporter [Gammaproteobacteria bacterium]
MTTRNNTTPYWRLSGFYFFYFASLGALIPYWGLYLKDIGFDAGAIGSLMAVIMATKIISPNIWGWIADHTGKRMAIVRIGSLCAVLAFIGVFYTRQFWWLALVMLVFSFFWNAALPQFEATTFNHLGTETHRYSSIRLWGSIGFVVAVWGLGELLEFTGMGILPAILLGLFIGIWLMSLWVPEDAAGHLSLDHEPLRKVLTQPAVLGLLASCFFMQASHGPYYAFYSIYMSSHGYSLFIIGLLWALGVIAEVIVFLFMHRLVPRFGLKRLLIVSLLLASLRWLMLGLFPDNLVLMLSAQCLHAATFGIYHAAAIQLIHYYFRGRHQGKGQALYSSLSFGAGGAIGTLLSGHAWESVGGEVIYMTAAVFSLIAALISWRSVDNPAFNQVK